MHFISCSARSYASVTKSPLVSEMGVGFKNNSALVKVLELFTCEEIMKLLGFVVVPLFYESAYYTSQVQYLKCFSLQFYFFVSQKCMKYVAMYNSHISNM